MSEMLEKKEGSLKRGLKRRHVSMIAIGGAIGTGLFVASGQTVSTSGPGGALVAYAAMGIMVYFMMTSLGEMATAIPVSGSFGEYCTRFVDPALGFAVAWNYWYSWSITVGFECVAASIVMKFWLPGAPDWIFIVGFFAFLYALNFFSARSFGEAEYWFAGIKVVAIIIFLILGVAMIFGILGGNTPGFANWTVGEAPFVGGFTSVIYVFLIAGFSFQGTELVGIAAGESENPEKDVPRAINTVFWRILIFFVGAILIISFLVPYTDENLLKSGVENITYSPFTIVYQRAGFALAASVMNAVVITSVLSCGNSGLYASTRMLYSLALQGSAPKCFRKVNSRGVPVNALNLTAAVAAMCFLAAKFGSGVVYGWLLNASALTGFIAWMAIAVSHYFFRRAYIAQGRKLEDLKYKALFYPFGPIFAAIVCLIIICGQIWTYGSYDLMTWLVAYIGVPFFIVMYAGYKIVKKTKMVKPEEADFSFVDTADKYDL